MKVTATLELPNNADISKPCLVLTNGRYYKAKLKPIKENRYNLKLVMDYLKKHSIMVL